MKRREKTVSYKKHQERKRNIAGLKVIGIDPAKEKHQVTAASGGASLTVTVLLLLIIKKELPDY